MTKRVSLLFCVALLALWILNSSLAAHGYARLTKAFQTIPTRTPTSQANPTQQSTPEATQQPTDQATLISTSIATMHPGTGTPASSPTSEASKTATTTSEPENQATETADDDATNAPHTPGAQPDLQGTGDQVTEEATQPSCDEPPCESPTPTSTTEGSVSEENDSGEPSRSGPPQPPTPVTGSISGNSETVSRSLEDGDNIGPIWLLLVGLGLLLLGLFGLIVERRRRSRN